MKCHANSFSFCESAVSNSLLLNFNEKPESYDLFCNAKIFMFCIVFEKVLYFTSFLFFTPHHGCNNGIKLHIFQFSIKSSVLSVQKSKERGSLKTFNLGMIFSVSLYIVYCFCVRRLAPASREKEVGFDFIFW